MIIDTLENLDKYATTNPLFAKAVEFLKSNNLEELPLGRTVLAGDDLFVNVVETPAKSKEEAKLETHKRMIDIQIPLTAVETMGYAPLCDLPETTYNETDDISFYPTEPQQYLTVKPGMFVVFFPQDGHAPAISPTPFRKIIVKVLA